PFAAQSREEYTTDVVRRIQALDGTSSAVLLDPDTGISINRKSSAHVTPEEVRAIWAALRQRDWLVLYQHASRESNWREIRRETFKAACGGAEVIQFCSRNGARDVAFFAASRSYHPR
ncbi:MAG TPA: hypothetical protein VGZ26_09775, partial [Pirellulales bacterium]|nr:hypothetical protein [Pirellulales bacterium]